MIELLDENRERAVPHSFHFCKPKKAFFLEPIFHFLKAFFLIVSFATKTFDMFFSLLHFVFGAFICFETDKRKKFFCFS